MKNRERERGRSYWSCYWYVCLPWTDYHRLCWRGMGSRINGERRLQDNLSLLCDLTPVRKSYTKNLSLGLSPIPISALPI